ncbi:hypothetical protein BKP45_03235 [Anaerobacillus alkalidiazotrophicus]|uniref:O-antigen ligase-related domain-containing protein n=1 Tax=Anaerobacillus alkalidiazotrophicus TaxID=472963 RepID=A0A1S2MD09_9BACI|nr:O-antigen ligase family protein [Anaerobacillus alkalidiazotrophicus]OIJ21727.1 hypothetical protein BKP45_03235 [Anaerobacillus alkalidiazotrophicus]
MLKLFELFLLKILMIFLPIHYLVFSILLSELAFLRFWKDIFIVLILILQLLKVFKVGEINKPQSTSLLIIIFIIYHIFWAFLADDLYVAFYMFRLYTEPLLLYFIFKNADVSQVEFKRFFNILLTTTVVICIYGVFQALILGDDFLKTIGYPYREENGRLSPSFYLSGLGNFQRVVGTFVSSNTFAFFACIMVIIFLSCKSFFKSHRYYNIYILTILSAILLSFSRSSWLGLGFGILFLFFKSKKKVSFFLTSITLITTLTVALIFGSIITKVDIIGNLNHLFNSTITLEDTSTVSHISSIEESVEIARDNLMGTGLGRNGPKAAQFYLDFYHTESSYFLIFFEFGVLGFILYFSIYISIFIRNSLKFDNKKIGGVYKATQVTTVFIIFAYIFLPYVQDMEIISFYFILAGLSDNRVNNSDF